METNQDRTEILEHKKENESEGDGRAGRRFNACFQKSEQRARRHETRPIDARPGRFGCDDGWKGTTFTCTPILSYELSADVASLSAGR